MIATRDFKEAEYLVLATRKGIVKKTRFEEYNTPLKADGIIAIKLRDDDALVDVLHSTGEEDIILVSRKGQAIRFHEDQVRSMGRATSGVKGMGLRKGDEVISAGIADDELDMLVVTDQGYGKRTRMKDYPVKGRGGLGVKTVQLTKARGQLAGAMPVSDGYAGDADLQRRHRDPNAGRGDQAARPLDAGRDRDAAPRGRAGLGHRARGRGGRARRDGRGDCRAGSRAPRFRLQKTATCSSFSPVPSQTRRR